ncbi:MAG: YebC/PmpR family DNA-binding transcriptional regulator, partial [Lachnospiraceae bacterium]|nr:YebC/PmpR family DNA-binding transcriptional regulator [Lachnospiraceae bacterium]
NGASDFNEEEDSYEILTAPDDFTKVREALEVKKIPMVEAELTMIPDNYISVTDEEGVYGLRKTLELLDEDDDVKAYYTNWEEEDDE